MTKIAMGIKQRTPWRTGYQREAGRHYAALVRWIGRADFRRLLFITITFPPGVENIAPLWTQITRQVFYHFRWAEDWARVFELKDGELHVHVLLRLRRPLKRGLRMVEMNEVKWIVWPRHIHRLQKRLVEKKAQIGFGVFDIGRVFETPKKLAVYVTKHARRGAKQRTEGGKRGYPKRPSVLRGVRVITFGGGSRSTP